MKRIVLGFELLLISIIGIYSCNFTFQRNQSFTPVIYSNADDTILVKNASYYRSKGYQVIPEFNIALKAPCKLKDVSRQASGDFDLNYAGAENENNPSKFAGYQIIITRLPVSYKYMSLEDQKAVKKNLLVQAQLMKDYKKVKVGHEEYEGFVMESSHNGNKLKGLTFIKDDLVLGLVVISNNDLESRFNQFTNSLHFINEL